MYSFAPSKEQQMLIDVVKRYAENDLRAQAHAAEESANMLADLIQKGWELGLLQASIPATYGGVGERSAVTSVLATEELAWGDLAGVMAILTPGLFALPILLAGSEAQKKAYLPKIVSGEWQPYTAALIEPAFDFDPNDLGTTAKLEGKRYVLNGEKRYVPYAADANATIVYANLDGETQGFIIRKDADGLTIGQREKLMGINALPNYALHLDNVPVPVANRLGGEQGHDFSNLNAAMQVAMAAMGVGMARAAFEYARDYAKQRVVLGSEIAKKQSIAFFLAEMATEIEAIRLLTWEAAWMLDNDKEDANHVAYLAVQGAMDMTMMVTDRGVQILGGHGYIRDHPVELWLRNGRGIAAMTGMAIV
ncbi:MAG: acyl-CoA dehydrogenase family protein [Chloroflexi bacterium]|nr:acyl-CoA dehydrogenase family protein [Chloroflexota bacterium]